MSQERAQWGSRAGFILAAAGSAVGLGNIWKFPYITGENGGGLFVLIYLVCIVMVGLPIMMAEIMIGRSAQKQPVAAFHKLQGGRTPWAAAGWLGVVAGFIILSFYIVVAGWAMDYTLKSVVNFTAPIHAAAEQEALNYRATTDVSEMRDKLETWRAGRNRDTTQDINSVRNQLRPSVWKGYDKYVAGLGAASVVDVVQLEATNAADPQSPTPISPDERSQFERVRSLLLEKEQLREQVERAEPLLAEIALIRMAGRTEAIEHYAAMTDGQVRDEAENLRRREVIAEQAGGRFTALLTDGWTSSFWATIFMLITILVVSRGVSGGIERACIVLMPALLILMGIMVVYGMTQRGFGEAFAFVFSPDPSRLKASGVLEALGHAFFTLSLGMGAMITYGSYQKDKKKLAMQSATIAGLDTLVALMACLMIFPIIFTYDQDAAAGPGLVFISMPLAFAEMGSGGMLLAIFFFGLLVFAALTSAISLLEVVSSYFIDERNWSRPRAAWVIGLVILAFGLLNAFANDGDFILSSWAIGFGTDFFTTLDYLASNWMLPLGGLFIALYAGWVMPRKMREAELEDLAPALVMGWLILIRYVAPALVIIVLLQKVGVLDANELLHPLFH